MNSHNKLLNRGKDLFFSILLPIGLALGINHYVFAGGTVDGPSMQSTLHNKDILFFEKISTETNHINRGDIVAFNSRDENNDNYIKRVIGIAGDTVEIKNDKVYLNGEELNESYLEPGTPTEPLSFKTKYIVPEGYIFVLGDNRTNSTDSRILGPINIKDVKGHAVVRVFPFNKMSILK